jgi:hypothetical protein
MKLLIIEDTLMHQAAAETQFPEAIVVSYDVAYEILRSARPGDYSAILTDMHFKVEQGRVIPSAPFDPHYPQNMAAIGQQLPFGLAFVLKGVELDTPVALVSDVDHHSDLFTGLLDMLGDDGFYPGHATRVPNLRFLLLRDTCPMAKDMYWDGSQIVQGNSEKISYKNLVKDWRVALRELTELFAGNHPV